jgi:hypothetical protein
MGRNPHNLGRAITGLVFVVIGWIAFYKRSKASNPQMQGGVGLGMIIFGLLFILDVLV